MIKSVLKGCVNFISRITLQLISFLAGIYCARILTLEEFGAYSLMKTIFMYSTFSSMGIIESILFKLPVALGKKDDNNININQKLLFTISFASIIFLIIFSFFGLFKIPLNKIPLRFEWILIGITRN